ncbi:MAG: PQQ-binding-like beta-propeller repeat protein [Prosthecobacter sp.]|jgi:outer membrane protein assembly factor BamB|uniref:outer membrane protein assembly factor BamB family protein n=1 Tax=Prosthecobacter sp. TaxID=1965333 RepID=UPI0019DA5010|nr:PQQ-binding-like beta-propeller repeat protein [Prosthecobacter sp.]MBE2286112.1 PQQ-binding-like beta-propeller repeat protein [Prosthecobacter sp.]
MRSLLLFFCAVSTLQAGDWPQFLGPNRTSTAVDEKEIRGDVEPEIVWQRRLGTGFAGAVVAKGRVIVFYRQDDAMTTEALSAADGQPIWKHSYKTNYRDSFGFDNGPRAVPCIAEGKVVTHGPEGIVEALDFDTGELRWRYDTVAELDSPQGFFGRVCSPLVVDGKVLLNVGGKGSAGIIALDLSMGKLVWKATDDEAGYSSPVLLPEDPSVSAFFTRKGVVITQNSDGKVLGDEFFRADIDASVNAAAPVPCGDGKLLFSAAYDVGAGLWQWNKTERKLTSLWKKLDTLDCHYTTPVYHDGHVYGLHGRQESGMKLRCIAVADGKVAWEAPEGIQGGTMIRVGDKLLLHGESGELWIFKATPEKFDLVRSSQITRAGHRSHAAFADGLLFARDAEKLVAVRVK